MRALIISIIFANSSIIPRHKKVFCVQRSALKDKIKTYCVLCLTVSETIITLQGYTEVTSKLQFNEHSAYIVKKRSAYIVVRSASTDKRKNCIVFGVHCSAFLPRLYFFEPLSHYLSFNAERSTLNVLY